MLHVHGEKRSAHIIAHLQHPPPWRSSSFLTTALLLVGFSSTERVCFACFGDCRPGCCHASCLDGIGAKAMTVLDFFLSSAGLFSASLSTATPSSAPPLGGSFSTSASMPKGTIGLEGEGVMSLIGLPLASYSAISPSPPFASCSCSILRPTTGMMASSQLPVVAIGEGERGAPPSGSCSSAVRPDRAEGDAAER